MIYDHDHCATDATLGFDVVQNYLGRSVRLGTYGSPKVAKLTAAAEQTAWLGTVSVIDRTRS